LCYPLTLQTPINSPEKQGTRSILDQSVTEDDFHIREQNIIAGAGSTSSVDVIPQDPDRDATKSTRQMGKSSSVTWVKPSAEECRQSSSDESSLPMHDAPFAISSYHTLDGDMEQLNLTHIDQYQWPNPALAETLVSSYFENIHHSFPILEESRFISTYRNFNFGATNLMDEETIWLCTANIILAISAFYAFLRQDSHRGNYYDHMVFHERSKLLYMNEKLLYEDARISTVCASGLLCLYYIATCRLDRAWTMCGVAIRHALTTGLHVRSEAEDLADAEKEHRIRIWWCLYSLECLLNQLTGRPTCISDRDIGAPLPLNITEGYFATSQAMYGKPEVTPHPGPMSRGGSRGAQGTYIYTPLKT
jgi:hypothetical protein